MSDTGTQTLRCIFYSHPWAALKLKEVGIGSVDNEVLVELAQTSLLTLTITPDSAPHKEGLTGALQMYNGIQQAHKKSLFAIFAPKIPDPFYKVAVHLQGFHSPLILAPTPSVSPAGQIASLLSASALSNQVKQITVLLHYQEAEVFSGLFPHVDEFILLWDIADLPDKKLIDLAQHLTLHRYITTESWGGFHLCQSDHRPVIDKVEREYQYRAVINQYFQ
jgi:hypothetical protein